MRWVSLTPMKPVCMLSATGHTTEWSRVNTMASAPRPNQSIAIGSSAMAGSGLSIAVRVLSRSLPKRVATASVVSTVAMAIPMTYPASRILIEFQIM